MGEEEKGVVSTSGLLGPLNETWYVTWFLELSGTQKTLVVIITVTVIIMSISC